jgi:hypothetical protein
MNWLRARLGERTLRSMFGDCYRDVWRGSERMKLLRGYFNLQVISEAIVCRGFTAS